MVCVNPAESSPGQHESNTKTLPRDLICVLCCYLYKHIQSELFQESGLEETEDRKTAVPAPEAWGPRAAPSRQEAAPQDHVETAPSPGAAFLIDTKSHRPKPYAAASMD